LTLSYIEQERISNFMEHQSLLPHLFRTEFSKICAVLTRRFGIDELSQAEDIASEVFLTALETWSYKGLPENPTAWLYTVAKNKSSNYLLRKKLFSERISIYLMESPEGIATTEVDLSDENISDSQLQMLFAICHPVISEEAQISLSLRILCGFGIDEIANALVTNKDTINKRLSRAKEKLREEKVVIEFPVANEIPKRLATVLTTLYLLFNEGYYSESNDAVLREDLCLEAIRLTHLLVGNKKTNLPQVNALLSLMCFHASRFPARKGARGEVVLYHDQNELLWNQELIAKGAYYLQQASQGETISKYHLEASIAYWHTIKTDTQEKWENILQLFNKLLILEYSSIAALNRTYALSKARGVELAIAEAEKLQLTQNQYYHTLLGELYTQVNPLKSKYHFQIALELAKSHGDKEIISRKISQLLIN
jgi:RNA polymerase sigma factor (sigma-70 family)